VYLSKIFKPVYCENKRGNWLYFVHHLEAVIIKGKKSSGLNVDIVRFLLTYKDIKLFSK